MEAGGGPSISTSSETASSSVRESSSRPTSRRPTGEPRTGRRPSRLNGLLVELPWPSKRSGGRDQLRAQLVALVRQTSLVPDAMSAVRQREHVEVADVPDGVVADLGQLARAVAGQARETGPLEPVL